MQTQKFQSRVYKVCCYKLCGVWVCVRVCVCVEVRRLAYLYGYEEVIINRQAPESGGLRSVWHSAIQKYDLA